jgi:hypothetical protein
LTVQGLKMDTIHNRRQAADQALAEWECNGVVDVGNWDFDGPYASCPVYYENPEDPDGPSIMGSFGVEFDDNDKIIGSWFQ